jgi:hypothetical protein
LLLEARGKAGRSVLYTSFGVSVLQEDGRALLYDGATGREAASAVAGPDALAALPVADGLLVEKPEGVFFNGQALGPGEVIGVGQVGDSRFAAAVSDGAGGAVYFLEAGAVTGRFPFQARGRAEAHFCGGYVLIASPQGDVAAYTPEGTLARVFTEKGYLAETGTLGPYLTVSYVSAASARYTFLLDPVTLETAAYLPGFLGALEEGTPVLDDGAGSLRAAPLRGLEALKNLARERLGGRALTPEEAAVYKAG